MKYLMVENPGEVGRELLTIVGVSTSRGHDNLIGQFGSGVKHAIALALRKGLKVYLYLGKEGFIFEVKRSTSTRFNQEVGFDKVVMRQISGTSKKTHDLGLALGFGALDWDDIGMAVREFISNALDACTVQGLDTEDVKVLWVDETNIKGETGFTRVYLEANADVENYKYVQNFQQFARDWDPKRTILDKTDRKAGLRVYRKGVLVGEFSYESLFDYNLNDIRLTESRVISESEARVAIANALREAPTAVLQRWFEVLASPVRREYFETTQIDQYSFQLHSWSSTVKTADVKKNWSTALTAVHGENAIICGSNFTAEIVEKKGFTPVLVPVSFTDALRSFGLRDAVAVLDTHAQAGRELFALDESQMKICDLIWSKLVAIGVTNGIAMPDITGYHAILSGSNLMGGYWDPSAKVVGLSADAMAGGLTFTFIKVAIEEFGHAITGAIDCTRDFQDWAFRVAALIMEEALQGQLDA
jgi:hypothetical protein